MELGTVCVAFRQNSSLRFGSGQAHGLWSRAAVPGMFSLSGNQRKERNHRALADSAATEPEETSESHVATLSPNQLCRRPFEHFLVAGIHYVPGRLDADSSLQVPNFESLLRRTTACLLVLCGLADKRPPCF